MRVIRYCIAVLALPGVAAGQTGWFRVTDAPSDAIIQAGDSTLGAARAVHALAPGRHRIVLVDGPAGVWNPRRAEVEIDVPDRDTVVVGLRLPVRYSISTVPSGAGVALEAPSGARESLGMSPLVVDRPAPMQGTVVALREGYAPARTAPGDSSVNRITMVLTPLSREAGAAVDWRPPGRSRAWIDIAAGAVALAAGAVAIHYKFQADGVDDRYRQPGSPERGDPALRAEAQRLDRISAGALGVMQLGLGFLAVRLVLR